MSRGYAVADPNGGGYSVENTKHGRFLAVVIRQWVATRLRFLADRIDPHGAPRAINWFFTFEAKKGLVFNTNGRGCQVWYYGREDYNNAYLESETLND